MDSKQAAAPAQAELDDFLAELDADFGKKKRGAIDAPHKKLNQQFHANNPQIGKAGGKSPEQIDASWKPEARITYVITQHCKCCGDKVSFIGGEYIRFRSQRQHATIIRRAEACTDLWHYGWGEEPQEVPDLVDEIHQEVARCPGCIKVEQQALEIWEAAKKQQKPDPTQGELQIEGL